MTDIGTDGVELSEDKIGSREELLGLMEGRANFYMLLARVFAREADAELLNALRSHKALLSAMRAVSRRGQESLKRFFHQNNGLPGDAVALDLAVEYARLFLGAGRLEGKAGAKPMPRPYASVYLSKDHSLMQEPWARIGAFYKKTGFRRDETARELDDHVSVVLEFLGWMAQSSMISLREGDHVAVREKLALQDSFLKDNVLTWVPDFGRDISRNASSGFYKAFGLFSASFVRADKQLVEELLGEIV